MTDITVPEPTRHDNWLAEAGHTYKRLIGWLKQKWGKKRNHTSPESPRWNAWSAPDVYQAWEELRTHPLLAWTPPMWRAVEETTAAREVMQRRAVSAIEANLIIEVRLSGQRGLMVRLATGRLMDRTVSGGVDPVVPAGSVDPNLSVTAPTFEDAVLALRDALTRHYGSTGDHTVKVSETSSVAAMRQRRKTAG
jgi:hypothetical protein